MKSKQILESVELSIYKCLLTALGEYNLDVPCTGVSKMFDTLAAGGAKLLPKDKLALMILNHICCNDTSSAIVHKLLNTRFSDLPIAVRPIIKPNRKYEVAFWTCGRVVSDRVKDLIDFNGVGGSGAWTDMDGKKHEIVKVTGSDWS
jgi:hypothetical protein